MPQELTETSKQAPQTSTSPFSAEPSQHGLPLSDTSVHDGRGPQQPSGGPSPGSVASGRPGRVDAYQLDEKLRRLSFGSDRSGTHLPAIAGQRIRDYENAATPTSPGPYSRHLLGFQVIKRHGSPSSGVQLTDFPNGSFPPAVAPPSWPFFIPRHLLIFWAQRS